jgi:hypothetical protein
MRRTELDDEDDDPQELTDLPMQVRPIQYECALLRSLRRFGGDRCWQMPHFDEVETEDD